MAFPGTRSSCIGLTIALLSGCAAQGSDKSKAGNDATAGEGTSHHDSTSVGGDATSVGGGESGTTVPREPASTSRPPADDTGDTSAGDMGDTSGDDTGSPLATGCPARAPSSWISCETFDDIAEASAELSEWNVAGGAFAVEPGPSVSGDHSLRIRLLPTQEFGGWVTLRFGHGPDAPAIDSPDGEYEEVWLRYWLRTHEDWPGHQIGDVGEIIAMDGTNWGIAADLNIQGDEAMRIRPYGWTCIFGGEIACDGQNDWSGALQAIWTSTGTTPVFDAAHAGSWQCMEAHMRLNDPRQSNGEAHVWVDGVLQIARTGIDWRGAWADYGLNAIRFTAFAPPPAVPLDFHIDDVVVATERVGCDT